MSILHKYSIITNSAEETEKRAFDIIENLNGIDNFILKGELGAGKTTFVKGILKKMGFAGTVTSPSFTLVNIYEDNIIKPVAHIDMYRITENGIWSIGIEDYLGNDYITFIEWGDKLPKQYFEKYIFSVINFEHLEKNKRGIWYE